MKDLRMWRIFLWPILLIELKWKESAESAIGQIINKKYTYGLENYGRPILLVSITYDKDAGAGKKKHRCRIVQYAWQSVKKE